MAEYTIRKSVGFLPAKRQNVWLHSVLADGLTIASFLNANDANDFLRDKRKGIKRHHARTFPRVKTIG